MKKYLVYLLLAVALLLVVWGVFGNSSAEQQTLAEKQALTGQQLASTNKSYAEPLQAEWKLYINEQMQASLEKVNTYASTATTTLGVLATILGVLAAILLGFGIFNYSSFRTNIEELKDKFEKVNEQIAKAETKLQSIEQVSKEVETKLLQANETLTKIEQVRQDATNSANELIKQVEDAKALKQQMEADKSQAGQCLDSMKNMQFEMSTITIGSANKDLAETISSSYPQDLLAKAEAGDAEAQFNLGIAYARGEGVSEDMFKAARWIKKAAEKNYAKACSQLGGMYYFGDGLLINKEEASKWWKKAADLGDTKAQFNIGLMLFKGDGIRPDEKKALEWFTKAANQGHAEAKRFLEEIKKTAKDANTAQATPPPENADNPKAKK